MVVEALQLILAVVNAVERRRKHDQEREDNAKDEVVAGLGQLVHLLHDSPANVKHCQIHLVHCTWLPYHTAHWTDRQHSQSHSLIARTNTQSRADPSFLPVRLNWCDIVVSPATSIHYCINVYIQVFSLCGGFYAFGFVFTIFMPCCFNGETNVLSIILYKSCSYHPSQKASLPFGRYQIILLDERDTCLQTNCLEFPYLKLNWWPQHCDTYVSTLVKMYINIKWWSNM